MTYEELYTQKSHKLPDMIKYHKQTVSNYKQDQDVEKEIREKAASLPTEGADEDDEQGALAGCVIDNVQTAMDEVVNVHSAATKQDKQSIIKQDYEQLNVDQKRIVNRVVNAVSENEEPIRLIVSGQGGTGKSRVIDVIRRLISAQAPADDILRVIVAAPTGLAAFNVRGSTIHRILCLPIKHGKPADYRQLSQDQLKTIRATLKGLRLLILDELSMVSSLTLMYIHLRLTEIMCNNLPFGRLNVVFSADLLQLPPVKGNQPFMPVSLLESKQRMGAIGTFDLWQTFQYDELTINIRQKNDETYAKILNRLRVGHITPADCTLLRKKLIAQNKRATKNEICGRYLELEHAGKSPLVLLPTTVLCDEINSAMLDRIGNTIHNLDAIDILETIVEKSLMPKIEKAYQKVETDTTKTAGLEKSLRLCVGARVMLKQNKDVDAGLVNGLVGIVQDFTSSKQNSTVQIHSVKVKF